MSSLNNAERLREWLESGQTCVGVCLALTDPQVSEMLGDVGYDFTWVDMEHSPYSIETGLAHVMAVRGTDCAPLVRVPSHDPVLIKPILELAPAGIIVPRVQTAEDVSTAVSGCRYPPHGARGYGPVRAATYHGMRPPAYLGSMEATPLIFVQIEDIEAVNNIDGILAVEGLDGVILGPCDLSGTMGKLGDITAPGVVEAMDRVVARCKAHGKLSGVATFYDAETFSAWIDKGVNIISLNTDFGNLVTESRRVLEAARARIGEGPGG